MKNLKIIVVASIALLAIIIALQNTKAVETKLLFMSVTMPRVLLLLITLIIGFVAGLLTASHILTKIKKPPK